MESQNRYRERQSEALIFHRHNIEPRSPCRRTRIEEAVGSRIGDRRHSGNVEIGD